MKKNNMISLAATALFLACACNTAPQKPEVKNVIYVIGDGMGLGAVSSLVLSEDAQTGFE